jgi:hypothetical protein
MTATTEARTESAVTIARGLVASAGAVFLGIGLVFFIWPGASGVSFGPGPLPPDNFPWTATPFVAQTIGGWAIGTGLIGLDAAFRWDVVSNYAGLLFFWAFSLLQLLVVILFRQALRTDHWFTWPYLVALITGVASAVPGLPLVFAARARLAEGPGVPVWVELFAGFLAVVVALLAVVLGIHDSPIEGRTIFPDVLTVFTVRAFSAFFLALLVGVTSLFLSRRPESWVTLARMGLYLVVPITLAAFLNIGKFDFAARPGGLIYLGLYLVVGVAAAYGIWWYRRNRRPETPAS